jgi:hypothetical protein
MKACGYGWRAHRVAQVVEPTMAEGHKWLAARTSERIRNLRPLALMRTNVYRKDCARHPMSGAIF